MKLWWELLDSSVASVCSVSRWSVGYPQKKVHSVCVCQKGGEIKRERDGKKEREKESEIDRDLFVFYALSVFLAASVVKQYLNNNWQQQKLTMLTGLEGEGLGQPMNHHYHSPVVPNVTPVPHSTFNHSLSLTLPFPQTPSIPVPPPLQSYIPWALPTMCMKWRGWGMMCVRESVCVLPLYYTLGNISSNRRTRTLLCDTRSQTPTTAVVTHPDQRHPPPPHWHRRVPRKLITLAGRDSRQGWAHLEVVGARLTLRWSRWMNGPKRQQS